MTEISLTTLCNSQLYPLLPHLREGWDDDFIFQSLGISPALWGQADDNNPALSSRVKFLNLIIPALWGQSRSNYPAPQPTYSSGPIPWLSQ